MITYRIELPKLMREKRLPMVAVELGVAEGLHSYDLLNNGIEKLYSIDAWDTIQNQLGDGGSEKSWHLKNFESAKERLKQFGEKSVILRGFTNEMATIIPDDSCGLVYIDADHSYEGVKRDINAYWSKLVRGGIMALHDYESDAETYGVKQAVTEFAKENHLTVYLLPENRPADAGAYFIKY
jgi:hypothetical protein